MQYYDLFKSIMTIDKTHLDSHLKNTLEIITGADKELCILAGCLSGETVNNDLYIYELSNFIEKENISLKILLTRFNKEDAFFKSKLLRRLSFYVKNGYSEKILIKSIETPIYFNNDETKTPIYFSLNDLGGYSIDKNNFLPEELRYSKKHGMLHTPLYEGFKSIFEDDSYSSIIDLQSIFK